MIYPFSFRQGLRPSRPMIVAPWYRKVTEAIVDRAAQTAVEGKR